ncbi:MAG: STAS domain-containing protein [Bacteroidia bacterium]|nr:STAS domain-containing protein [Bacteroidia bacterium]MDW8157908.1 STAS domain-containing protein [Bacteroidia bacterium]
MEDFQMNYQHFTEDKVVIFQLEGSLLGESDRLALKNEFANYLDKDFKYFLIDLTNLKHINSTGLGVFITLYTKVRAKGGEMILCNPSDNILNLLNITKLNSVFSVVPTLEEGKEKLLKERA